MATQVKDIVVQVRELLVEKDPRFWSDEELIRHVYNGCKDMWRDIVDLKQEHFLFHNTTEVTYQPDADRLTGVPSNVHKVYMIEALDQSSTSTNVGLQFRPLDYNHDLFRLSRTLDPIAPQNNTVYYSITSAGGPVSAPVILCAPKVSSVVNIAFTYVPTIEPFSDGEAIIPIPGEADSALVAWTVAWARAKERDDRMPDPGWFQTYSTLRQHILQSLGTREYQEPYFVDAMFESYWS